MTGESLLKTVGTFIAVTYSFKRFSFCSYFLLTLISFENLSLFYIFMNIPIIPNFIYQIYYELLNLQFVLKQIFKCLRSETINKIRLTSSFDLVFLTEFIINIPSFVIPAVLRIRIPYSSFY